MLFRLIRRATAGFVPARRRPIREVRPVLSAFPSSRIPASHRDELRQPSERLLAALDGAVLDRLVALGAGFEDRTAA